MATYKVLQDIEAEDTLIGPLTLRQCIYAAIGVINIYLSVVFVTKGVPFMVIFTLPFIAFGVFFAFPWTKQQTTEVWALAKVRFYLKPRKRIWNQTGAHQLVTITAPKVVKRSYTSALSPREVESRLKALADTIDSRGWAVKNVDLGYFTQPSIMGSAGAGTDRLVTLSNLPQDVPATNTMASEDIFDVAHNPIAQKFDAMMSQQAGAHREQLMQQMATPQPQAQPGVQQPAQPDPAYWHMQTQPAAPQPPTTQFEALPPAPVAAAQPIQPVAQPLQPASQPVTTPAQNMTAAAKPAILDLANNNDLDIATIAREAQARTPEPPDEISVSLR